MQFSDETLMAYADGELDAATRDTIEAAMAGDPQIAAAVERHRRLKAELLDAFGGVADEPVPERLLTTAQTAPATATASLADLAQRRAAKAVRPRWSWREWGAMAASVLLGVVVTRVAVQRGSDDSLIGRDGHIIASGTLAAALDSQLSGVRSQTSQVVIGLSYRDKAGKYCRTFVIDKTGSLAGVACHERDAWQVQAMIRDRSAAAAGNYRMANTTVPPVILQTVQDSIDGDALDTQAETQARAQGWRAK